MQGLEVIALKAVLGGLLVVLFALVGEVLQPKEFAGLLAASPSVATASLLVTSIDKGADAVRLSALGMAAGAVGMILYCIVGVYAVRRFKAKSTALSMIWARSATWMRLNTCPGLVMRRARPAFTVSSALAPGP